MVKLLPENIRDTFHFLDSWVIFCLLFSSEFDCLAYLRDRDGMVTNLLITKSRDGSHTFNCWVSIAEIAEQPHGNCRSTRDVLLNKTKLILISLYGFNSEQIKHVRPSFSMVHYFGNCRSLTQCENIQIRGEQWRNCIGFQLVPLRDVHGLLCRHCRIICLPF